MAKKDWISEKSEKEAPFPWDQRMQYALAWAEGYNAAVAAYKEELNSILTEELEI